jgi:hypothetical protein
MPPRARTDDDQTPAEPTAAPQATATLAVGYPHDEFAPFGGNDPDHKLVVTAAGTPVPQGQVDDVKAAAKAADVTIREVH